MTMIMEPYGNICIYPLWRKINTFKKNGEVKEIETHSRIQRKEPNNPQIIDKIKDDVLQDFLNLVAHPSLIFSLFCLFSPIIFLFFLSFSIPLKAFLRPKSTKGACLNIGLASSPLCIRAVLRFQGHLEQGVNLT